MEKIGIIDLGSNSARLVVVEMLGDGHFMVVDQLKESVRLGQDMERDGFMKASRIAETIKTLKMFKRLCDAYSIEKIIAVATAAVRRAKNQRSFLDEVATSCGLKLRVLSAEEEATYVYKGVVNSMDIPKGVIFEIGGGSTKIVQYNRKNLINYVTLPFGAITLTEMFNNQGFTPEEQSQKIEEFFEEQLSQIEWLNNVEPDSQLICVGGSCRSLCKISRMMKKSPLNKIHNHIIQVDEFESIYNMVKVLDLDKKKRIRGISSKRADILPSAFSALNCFIKHMKFEQIVISACGLREGLMFNYAMPSTMEKPISDVLTYSLETLVKYYKCNEAHVNNVVNLSVILYKQLRVLHKFPRQNLKLLKAVAMLYSAGAKIKFYDFGKHTAYMIQNATIYGLSDREIVLASMIASVCQNDDFNAADLVKYREYISEDDVETIRKLGLILRIANSFDRSMEGIVKDINCDILGDSVIMKTEITGDASLEIKDALTASQDFRRVFRKSLEIM